MWIMSLIPLAPPRIDTHQGKTAILDTLGMSPDSDSTSLPRLLDATRYQCVAGMISMEMFLFSWRTYYYFCNPCGSQGGLESWQTYKTDRHGCYLIWLYWKKNSGIMAKIQPLGFTSSDMLLIHVWSICVQSCLDLFHIILDSKVEHKHQQASTHAWTHFLKALKSMKQKSND